MSLPCPRGVARTDSRGNRRMDQNKSCESRLEPYKLPISYAIGFAAAGFTLWTAWVRGTDPHLQVLISIMGILLGWIIGLYVTPTTAGEKEKFSDFGKTLTALAV